MHKRYYIPTICSVLFLLSCATQQDLDNQSSKIEEKLKGIQDSIGIVNNSLSNINDSFEELSKRNHEMDSTLHEEIESLWQEVVDSIESIKSVEKNDPRSDSGISLGSNNIILDSIAKMIISLNHLRDSVSATNVQITQINNQLNQLNQSNFFNIIRTINKYSSTVEAVLSPITQGVLFAISLISFILLTIKMEKKDNKIILNILYKILHLFASSILGASFGILLTKGILLFIPHSQNIIK